MNINRIIKIVAMTAVITLPMACSSGVEKGETEVHTDRGATKEVSPRDSDLYLMGVRHADLVISQSDKEDSVAARLLEIRSRETYIRQAVDEDASEAYITGFTTRLKEGAPEIARQIF